MSTLDDMSFVAATGNVTSMLLVGPMLVLLGRRRRWSRRRMLGVSLLGWTALLVAQLVMWRVFGYTAGYPGFKYIQPAALPISACNFVASLVLTKQSKQDKESDVLIPQR